MYTAERKQKVQKIGWKQDILLFLMLYSVIFQPVRVWCYIIGDDRILSDAAFKT